MITHHYRYVLLTLLKLADLLVIGFAFMLAVFAGLPDGARWNDVLQLKLELQNFLFLLAFLAFCHILLQIFGLYRSHRLTSVAREWHDLVWVLIAAAAPLFVAGRLFQFDYATLAFLPRFTFAAFVGLVFERQLFRIVARHARRHGHNIRHVVVVGRDDSGLDLASRLARRADLGYAVEGVVDAQPDEETALARVTELLESRPVDEVFVSLPLDAHHGLIRDVVALCEEQGVTIRVVSSLVDLVLARAQLDEIDGRPVISIFSGPPDSLLLAVKRLLDVTVAGLAVALSSPLWALIAIAIKLDSPGPVFFVQDRVGMGGRRFRFFKFRTMVPDAEQRQAAIEHLNESTGPVFKIRKDPRVTRVGELLRKFSLDELPQFLNVLRGDMSLVGPRPLPVRDVQRMDSRAHKRRFSVKPGITCLWQIAGRVPDFEKWIETDIHYIDNWSLGLDLKILMKTIPAVISGRGAY
jgi:exopolysaccharide biosynthesis polyprenyl glycosylphosphotransferase